MRRLPILSMLLQGVLLALVFVAVALIFYGQSQSVPAQESNTPDVTGEPDVDVPFDGAGTAIPSTTGVPLGQPIPTSIPTPPADSPYYPIGQTNLIQDGPGLYFDDWSPSSDAILIDVFNGNTVEMPDGGPPPYPVKMLFDLKLVTLSPITIPVTLEANAEMGQWSPNGQKIAFRRYIDAGRAELYTRPGGKIADTDFGLFEWVSPDIVAFGRDGLLQRLNIPNGLILPALPLDVRVIGRDEPRKAILYSPDGNWLAYARGSQLRLMDSKGLGSRILSEVFDNTGSHGLGRANMAWSRDSRRLAYVESSPEGYGVLKIFDTGSMQSQEVVRLIGTLDRPSWFPDGNAIVFGRSAGSPIADILVVTLGDHQLLQLGRGFYPELSPDGRKVAFQRSERDLWMTYLGH